jgi:hypothetical protein
MKWSLAILILVLGVVTIAAGAVFIGLAAQKQSQIVSQMREEKVTVGLSDQQIANGELVDNAAKAQAAADKVREDRKSIAPTYNDLIKDNPGGRYDPTNPKDVSYTQALNLENYLYTAVLSFGVLQAITGIGAALIVVGVALGIAGVVLSRLARRVPSP